MGFPLKVKYANFRNLGSGQAWWRLNTCNAPHTSADCKSNPAANSSFNFGTLDAILTEIKTAGVNDILFTLANTPAWAASYTPPRGTCTVPPASCILPPDINPDGSGANAIWDNWVEHIAAHVNNPTWLQTHAHVKYWEPWNEVFSDLTISGCCPAQSSTGTYAQHLRLTEDTRCLIVGTGTIHNYPSAVLRPPLFLLRFARVLGPLTQPPESSFRPRRPAPLEQGLSTLRKISSIVVTIPRMTWVRPRAARGVAA